MKTISFITVFIFVVILLSFSSCAPVPKGKMQFENRFAHEKIPLTSYLIIPESSRNYRNSSMGIKFNIGPLFAENVPIALQQVFKDVSASGETPSDFILTANLNNFSVSLSTIFPVVNATVTYELCANDKNLFKKLTTTQSYKSSFGSPNGPELYKMVILECLEDLNTQLLEQKNFIVSKTMK